MRTDKEMDLLMHRALASDVEPEPAVNDELVRMWEQAESGILSGSPKRKGKKVIQMKNRRKMSMAAVAVICVLAMSATVTAAVKYLSKEEVITQLGGEDVKDAFETGNVLEIDQTVEQGDYIFKLYALATKEQLAASGLEEGAEEGGTYAVVSIAKKDGTPMPATDSNEYGEHHFFVSPLIQGLEPWQYNIASMGGSYSEMEKNGLWYRIIKCDDISLFADRQIYLCILNSVFYETEAYHYNEGDGTITRNEDYSGVNILWNLSLDASKADKSKAAEYLKELEESWKPEEGTEKADGVIDTGIPVLDKILLAEKEKGQTATEIEELPIETLLGYAVLNEESVKALPVAADGTVHYLYNAEDGHGCEEISAVKDLFPDGKPGVCMTGYSYGEGENGGVVRLNIYAMDESGTIKGMEYIIKDF